MNRKLPKLEIVLVFCFLTICAYTPARAATTITGRVILQQHGQDEWVTLQSFDAKGYILTGTLLGPLKKIAQEKPAFNLVTISGVLTGKNTVSCERKRTLNASGTDESRLQEEAIWVQYYFFEANHILSVAESTEPLPPLTRDAAREKQMLARHPVPKATPAITGEIYGTITTCNFRSPVKTIAVKNRERNSPIASLTILISADTKIVKNIGTNQPVVLPPDSLKAGQRVTVVYATNDIRTEALYITITGE
jgi:hypothetical protein